MKVLKYHRIISAISLILGFTIRRICGYSTGAPTRACGNMTPQHGYPVNVSPAPYLVEISKTQYSPNERIYVRLRACGNARFKGFMIQPRSAMYPDRPAFLGAFARVQGTRYECVRTGAVLTHNSPVEKQSVTLTWIAPPGAAGHVVFRVTFVQAFNSYWVAVNSPVVYDGVSRDLTMMQAFSLRSSTHQSCLPPRSTTTAPTTTNATTTTSTTTLPPTTTTTTTTEPTTTTTTTEPTTTTMFMPTTTTTMFMPTTTTTMFMPTTTTTMFVPTTTTTTMFFPTAFTTTTGPSTTTTKRTTTATTTTTAATTPYFPTSTDETSTYYWPDYWDTTTEQASEISRQTAVPTIFPTAPTTLPTTTTTTEATTTTTTTEPTTTTTTVTFPPTTTTTTTDATTTTTPATTTTTIIPSTTTTEPPPTTTILPTTTTTDIPATTTMPPFTTTPAEPAIFTEKTVPPQPTAVPTTPYYPTYPTVKTTSYYPTYPRIPTTPYYPTYPTVPFDNSTKSNGIPSMVPTAVWPTYETSSKAPVAPTIPYVPEIKLTTEKRVEIKAATEETTTESIPDITFPRFTEKHRVYTTTIESLAETSTTEESSTLDIVTFPWETTEGTIIRESDLELIPDRGCGVTQGCFDDCRNGVCNFIVSWKPDRYSTRFEIKTKPGVTGPYWAAIGFSDDRKMGLDSVTECITEDTKVKVYQSYNLDYYRNLRLITPKLGISDEFGKMQNGIFHCSFTRENYVAGEKDVSDLNKDWFMMFAEGPAVNGIKIPHRYDAIPPTTDVRVNLQQYPPMHITYDPTQAQPHVIDNSEKKDTLVPLDEQRYISRDENCGEMQSCLQDCTPFGCRFIVSWISGPKHVIFKLRAVLNATANRWIAIAFSHDSKMGDDNVVQCVSNDNGEISVSQSYNQGKTNMRIDDANSGLSNTSGSFVDGIFECGFARQTYVENTETIFDLEKPWNLLFATGRAKKGIMLPHSFDDLPHASEGAVNFTRVDFTILEPSLLTANTLFIKIHASLMLFAWILCASVATVIGRYFQPFWWGEKMIGSRAWIRVHWLFVILTVLSVIAAFSLIFVGVDGMSKLFQDPGAHFNSAHPVMGLIVAVLVLLNPLLLLLRPSEESQTRAFFDCVYWIVEMGAHVLAVVTIYAGFGLADHIVPFILAYCLIGFACYQVLVLLFMEGLKSYDAKKTVEKKKMYLYEMQIRPWNPRRNNSFSHYVDVGHSSKGLKRVILSFHFLVLTALTTVMILLLVISEPTEHGVQHGIQPAVH